MKLIRYIGNPWVFIGLYCLLLIEGDNFGGFYLLYLLLALPHAAPYAILSVAGIIILALSQNRNWKAAQSILSSSGVIVMLIALVVFFSPGNKNGTFQLTMPILSFVLCGISCTCLLINNFYSYSIRPLKDFSN